VLSRDELKQYEMERKWSPRKYDFMRYFIGDVRDRDRLSMALRGIDLVVHAAALKQVPAAEYNPFECINTNVIGAENIVHAAIMNNVGKVIALSTDKAANPVNLYGASKLAADKIFLAANNLSGKAGTRFAVVRYGNVLGSRGSVVPYFKHLIEGGAKSLPITDKRMTRFWITIDQGVAFVLSSIATMTGSEMFVPKIPSMRIVDIAKALAPHLPQEEVGIRPGEKLHEVLVTSDDGRNAYDLGDRYVIAPSFDWWRPSEHILKYGRKLSEDFAYTSDTNPEWLDPSELLEKLAKA
jgi:UDP-N-acetylglucosamine 4,6-dehydratase